MHCLLELMNLLPPDFYEHHGEETLSIVFKLTFYHYSGIFDDEKPLDASAATETKINYSIH